jgi:hypothetical protein
MPHNEERHVQGGGSHQRIGSPETRSARFYDLLNAPASRKTPLGTDTAWALKLKAAVDSAARELDVKVHSAKPICVFDSNDPNDMVFELDTECGRLQATRSRSGAHSFKWVE